MNETEIEKMAGELYTIYCQAMGGKAFNGDPLPNWEKFRADEKKKVQSDAWMTCARHAIASAAAV